MTIPPKTQMDVPTRVARGAMTVGKETDWMIEHQELQPGVHLARALIDGAADEVLVRVVNISGDAVTLRENDHLGELWPVTVTERPGTPRVDFAAAGKELLSRMDCEAPVEVKGSLKNC